MGGKRRRHALDDVTTLVQAGGDDRLAQHREAPHVQRDVVVNQEDDPGTVVAGIGDVGDDAGDRARVEVPPAHLDDRAEAAVVRAAPRRLDDVHGIAEEGVAPQHAGAAVGQLQRVVESMRRRPVRIRDDIAAGRSPGQAGNDAQRRVAAPELQRPQQFAERCFALAAHHGVYTLLSHPRVGRKTGIVTTGDDGGARTPLAQAPHEAQRRASLERHRREPDHVWRPVVHEPLHGLDHRMRHEDEIGDGDGMVRVDVAGERRECAVGHAHAHRRRVLERIRHGEEQHVHGRPRCRG